MHSVINKYTNKCSKLIQQQSHVLYIHRCHYREFDFSCLTIHALLQMFVKLTEKNGCTGIRPMMKTDKNFQRLVLHFDHL